MNNRTIRYLIPVCVIVFACTPPVNPRVLLAKEGVEYAYPHFSNDGARLLFQSNEHGSWQLCTVDLNSMDRVTLTPDTMNAYFPDWSPDGTQICFVSDRSGTEEIYIMMSDGTAMTQLTRNGSRNIHPYFSPDGKTILFSSTLNSGGNLELYSMRPDGSGITRLTRTADHETCARMSPDGQSITFLRNNETGLDDLFLMTLDDSSAVNLTNTPTMDGWPSWIPGSRKIIYSAVENDVFKLFQYDVDDQSTIRLTNPTLPNDDCRANASPDGSMIVFNRQHRSDGKTTNELWILER